MKNTLLLLLILSFVSCKNNSEEEQGIRIILELKINQNDDFKVLYKSSETVFSNQNTNTQKVIAEPDYQKIKFIIPESFPFIRFDFGEKKNQEVSIKSITFKLRDKEYRIDQEDVYKSFGNNKWTELTDAALATYKPVIINGTARPKIYLKPSVSKDMMLQLKE